MTLVRDTEALLASLMTEQAAESRRQSLFNQEARRMLAAANMAPVTERVYPMHPLDQEVLNMTNGDSHEALTFHALNAPERTPSNPKDAIGSTKLPLHLWPAEATAMGCLGMLEGREKYGRNNMIAGDGVIASIYVDAAKRHLDAWFAGEELTHDTGIPHLANALATIAIIVKCQAHGKMIDDRDYGAQPGGAAYRALVERLTPYVKKVRTLFADKKPRHYTIADSEQVA